MTCPYSTALIEHLGNLSGVKAIGGNCPGCKNTCAFAAEAGWWNPEEVGMLRTKE